MAKIQAALLAKKVVNPAKTLWTSSKTLDTSVSGSYRKDVFPSPSLIDVHRIQEANMDGDDTPSQFDQDEEEQEEIEEDKDSISRKPTSK